MMPWVTLPYVCKRTKQLKFVFNATEVPTLIIMRCNGQIIADNARDLIVRMGADALEHLKFQQ